MRPQRVRGFGHLASALVFFLALVLIAGGRAYAAPPAPGGIEVAPLPTPVVRPIPPEVLRQIDEDLAPQAGKGDVTGQELPDPVRWIIHKVVEITVTVPWQHVTNSMSRIFASSVSRDMRLFGAAEQQLGEAAQQIGAALMDKKGLGEVSTKVAQATVGIGAAFFLLRLLIYHWRRLMGESDDLLSVVGDWITAGALAALAPNIVVLALDVGVEIAQRAFGTAFSDMLQQWVDVTLGPYGSLVNLLHLASEVGFMSVIGLFIMAILTVVAIVAVLFIVAATIALSYLLVAIGPIAAVVSVVPQMRWARTMWLKAVFLMGIIPVAVGTTYYAFAKVFAPASNAVNSGLTPEAYNPFIYLVRLIWLVGAVSFLLSAAGAVGKLSLSSAMVMVSMGKQAAGAVVGMATLAATGGASLPALVGLGGTGAMTTPPTVGGGGDGGSTFTSNTTATSSPDSQGSNGSDGTGQPTSTNSPPPLMSTPDNGTGRLLSQANKLHRGAAIASLLGARGTGGLLSSMAMRMERQAREQQMRMERQAREEQLRQRMAEDPGVQSPMMAQEMGKVLGEPVREETARGVLVGVRGEGGSVAKAPQAFRQFVADWQTLGGKAEDIHRMAQLNPKDVGKIVAAYQRGVPADNAEGRVAQLRDSLPLAKLTRREMSVRIKEGGQVISAPAPQAGQVKGETPPEGSSVMVTSPPPSSPASSGGGEPPTQLERVVRQVKTPEDTGGESASPPVSRAAVTPPPPAESAVTPPPAPTAASTPAKGGMGQESGRPATPTVPTMGGNAPTPTPRREMGEHPEEPSVSAVSSPQGGGIPRASVVTSSPGAQPQKPSGGPALNEQMTIMFNRLPPEGQKMAEDFLQFSPGAKERPHMAGFAVVYAHNLNDAMPEQMQTLFAAYQEARQRHPGNTTEDVVAAWQEAKERYVEQVYGGQHDVAREDPVLLTLDPYMRPGKSSSGRRE